MALFCQHNYVWREITPARVNKIILSLTLNYMSTLFKRSFFCLNRWAKFYIYGIYSNIYNRHKITALVDRRGIFVLMLTTAPLTRSLGQSLTFSDRGITASYKMLKFCVVLYCCYSIQRKPIVLYCFYSIQPQPIVLYCFICIQRQPIVLLL